ncbi:MAG: hypothetical protein IKS32_09115 [Solobacterium sp.]|nr:hypothetical protein [Solobacterium sp.]
MNEMNTMDESAKLNDSQVEQIAGGDKEKLEKMMIKCPKCGMMYKAGSKHTCAVRRP